MLALPKSHLSYSAISLWQKNKEQFRAKYYENEPQAETAEMIFGKKIAKLLEEKPKDKILRKVPRYRRSEQRIEIYVGHVPVLGYIDTFAPRKCAFREYKTGHTRADGSAPWNAVAVLKHDQLPFYSLLIKLWRGKVTELCHLDWLETEWAQKKVMFDGHELSGQGSELRLTGRIETFERVIEEWERERIADIIQKSAQEISDDFKLWKTKN